MSRHLRRWIAPLVFTTLCLGSCAQEDYPGGYKGVSNGSDSGSPQTLASARPVTGARPEAKASSR